MAGKAATEELELIELGGGRGPRDAGFGRDDAGAPLVPQRIYFTGIWLALAAILMFFMGLTSSFVVRKGLSGDWVAFSFPRILWLNTTILLLSSVTIERARRALLRDEVAGFHRWWRITTALGLGFLAGQVVAWQELAAAGVYIASNPSSSFFYLLTAAHGIHLLGGLTALLWVGRRPAVAYVRATPLTAVTVSSIYWHFMDGLWVFLVLLLFLGR